jgi:hypothetical protein
MFIQKIELTCREQWPRERGHSTSRSSGKLAGKTKVKAVAALVVLAALHASPSFAQISGEAMNQCAALTNSVRRLTCYDLLAKLRPPEPPETTGRSEGVAVHLSSEQMSKLDAWIDAQPEPKPGRPEAIRGLLDPVLQSQTGERSR